MLSWVVNFQAHSRGTVQEHPTSPAVPCSPPFPVHYRVVSCKPSISNLLAKCDPLYHLLSRSCAEAANGRDPIIWSATFIPDFLSCFFSYSCALFCAFLHLGKTQPLSFHVIPHSLAKTPGGGVPPPLQPSAKNQGHRHHNGPAPQLTALFPPPVTAHRPFIIFPTVAALPPGCYDLVFHDPR
jgi:hypothetical protein